MDAWIGRGGSIIQARLNNFSAIKSCAMKKDKIRHCNNKRDLIPLNLGKWYILDSNSGIRLE
jgi:hypothetical protein